LISILSITSQPRTLQCLLGQQFFIDLNLPYALSSAQIKQSTY